MNKPEYMTELEIKNKNLENILKKIGKLAVAFSGGVDSAYLLYEAHRILGDNVLAVTAASAAVPESEIKEALDFCKKRGIRHIVCRTDELKVDEYRKNSQKRCYYCKKEIFKNLAYIAHENGITIIADGSNVDDEGDYRPGLTALEEMGIRSPLREAGYTKDDIRFFSEKAGLPTWNKPSFACLASRIPYGDEITEEKLRMAGEAELFLRSLGFDQVRVRVHGKVARIETLAGDFSILINGQIRERIYEKFKQIGFTYTAVDLRGYRQGSLNESIND